MQKKKHYIIATVNVIKPKIKKGIPPNEYSNCGPIKPIAKVNMKLILDAIDNQIGGKISAI